MKPYTVDDAALDYEAALTSEDAEAIALAGAALTALDVPPVLPSLHSAALWYAQHGLHVFRLQPGTKVPFKFSRGCKEATTDAGQIDTWWTESPDANIGIATGHLVDVIDVDGFEGVCSYVKIIEELPQVYGKVSTPRPGGMHLYVAAVPGRGNRAGVLPHVDYRGLGGYVVAPPSVNEQGRYEWIHPLEVDALVKGVAA